MTQPEKLARLKTLLTDEDNIPDDNVLSEYLSIAEAEILNWLYIRVGSVPETAALPPSFDQVQIFAVIAAINIMGAEGESLHIENGTHRQFKYDDLLAYIRTHVPPYVTL